MNLSWNKKPVKTEKKDAREQLDGALSEDVLGQIWGGVAAKGDCHTGDAIS
ncbi:hypothetical protein [Archangium lipolyticum]|uniref:hypothetical protein n=1 Tax=Archangium lipolyticum TaxID=2970465 RepID=UPI002149F0AE|nr:hypothetical protein [Archangium lipolyticum]